MPEKFQKQFGIDDMTQAELSRQYKELEVIVERVKKIRKQLTGFSEIFVVYRDLYDTVKPIKYFISKDVMHILTMIITTLCSLLMLVFGMPLMSGFMRLPWIEFLGLALAATGLVFINTLKSKLGLTI